MRHHIIVRAFLLAAISLVSAPGVRAQARPATTMARPSAVSAPAPADVQAFTSASVCSAHAEVAGCAQALQRGLVLFTWSCAGCDHNWSAAFVVNGQQMPAGDINVSTSKLSALTVRAGQFKSTDCVAIRVFNPANAAQQGTSTPLCLTHTLAAAGAAPAAVAAVPMAAAPATHPAGAPAPHPAPGTTRNPPHAPGTPGGTVPTSNAHAAGVSSAAKVTVVNASYVPAPKGLAVTHDQKDCNNHGGVGGGLACAAALPAGQLALVWNCAGCKVDGYHLYRVDILPQKALPANGAYSNDAKVTLALLEPPAGGFTGKCYAVTAYRGSLESSMSNAYCAGSGSTMATVTLQPEHTLHGQHYRASRTGTLGYTNPPIDSYDGTLYVGYADHYWNNEFGDVYDDYIHRTGLYFDLSSLAGKTVVKAVLQFDAFSSWHDYDNTSADSPKLTAQSPEACVEGVDKATDHWWQNNDLSSSVKYVSQGPFVGPTFGIEVTSAIQGWLGGGASSNFGFIVRGGDENDLWHGNANHVCLTQLNSASLVVTYH